MKKLMIAACAVAFAAVAQAGTVSWTIVSMYDGANNGENYLTSGIGYLFDNAKIAQDQVVATIQAQYGAGTLSTWLNANALGKEGTAFSFGAKNDSGQWSSASNMNPTDLGLDHGKEYTLYSVIFNEGAIGKDTEFYVTNTKTQTTKGGDSGQNAAFSIGAQKGTQGTAYNSTVAGNWNAMSVPEPTSGLLLLLGMAGLALRRRRA